MHVKAKSNSDTSNNRVNWNHPKIIQTVPQQHTGKSGNYKMHPYWALHTYFGKYQCESTKHI